MDLLMVMVSECPSFGTKIRAAIKEVCVWWLGTAKKLRVAFFFFFLLSTFGGIWGAKEIWRIGICERSASVVGWLRGVGGEPRSLTAAGRNK